MHFDVAFDSYSIEIFSSEDIFRKMLPNLMTVTVSVQSKNRFDSMLHKDGFILEDSYLSSKEDIFLGKLKNV